MLIPRIGAIVLLVAYGFAVASIGRLMYVTAREGYSSWIPVAILLAPSAILGITSAVLVLRRNPLGTRLALPFCIVLGATAIMTFLQLPPVGRFLDDYQKAELARGVTVPPYLANQGVTPAEYVESQVGDVRGQGAIGAIAVIVIYIATVVRGGRDRIEAQKRSEAAKAEKARGRREGEGREGEGLGTGRFRAEPRLRPARALR